MELLPLYKNRVYVPEESRCGFYNCPSCGRELTDREGNPVGEIEESLRTAYCTGSNGCELEVSYQSIMIGINRMEPGWGVDKTHKDAVTLFIDGHEIARAYIENTEFGDSTDVAYMHLCGSMWIKEDDETAKIIADFAKWIRFDWATADKQGELPTLVRLTGTTHDKSKDGQWPVSPFTNWIALMDATKIKVEHLAPDFTWKELVPA